MRFAGLLLGDFRFQIKYGFYFLYAFLTVFYSVILWLIPMEYKDKSAAIIIFTDPATLGMFFMGAIILLEKSQRVLPSLAVSPVTVGEYIFSKILSLGAVSTAVGLAISLVAGVHSPFFIAVGTFLGSLFFSLIGIILAAKAASLNLFLLLSTPIMLFLMLPPFFEIFGFSYFFFTLHPGNTVLRLITGQTDFWGSMVFMAWTFAAYFYAHRAVRKMLNEIEGIHL